MSDLTQMDVPGVVGVFSVGPDGQYAVVDVFDVDVMPGRDQVTSHARRDVWLKFVLSLEQLRFDIFPMPGSTTERRRHVVELIQRSCDVWSQSPQRLERNSIRRAA